MRCKTKELALVEDLVSIQLKIVSLEVCGSKTEPSHVRKFKVEKSSKKGTIFLVDRIVMRKN